MHYSREEIETLKQKIIVKAWKDKKFRERLLKKPTETIRELILKETGQALRPENWKFQVFEEPSHTTTIILPPSPSEAMQLSETELEEIAGGQKGGLVGWQC